VTLIDGTMIYLTRSRHASVIAAQKQNFFYWLRDHGHGSLITEQVHASTLKAWVKEQTEAGREVPTDLLTIYEEITIGVRKAKNHE
jgi:hypothetical protein